MTDSDLAAADHRWMKKAIELSYQCPPADGAYSVGAVIVDANGEEITTGYSREVDNVVHAEEAVLGKLAAGDPRLATATIYSTLEPCSQRKSRPRTCAQLIIESGIRRVVLAWREPSVFGSLLLSVVFRHSARCGRRALLSGP
jgi:diaminohydroxyphosphoribosylaminopyrimidine deaminase / 5-amino-6-(5-phosphoribosylamino)uracil reductase